MAESGRYGDSSREFRDHIFNHKNKADGKLEVRPGYELSKPASVIYFFQKALPPYNLLRIARPTEDQVSK